ncbi:MAG: flagellar basal body protein [Rhodomicrobium sp.]
MITDNIFDLAAHQASWLLARQNLVAQNVANANTPGYRAADLQPFEASLQGASLQLVTTSAGHTSISGNEPAAADTADDVTEAYFSGNDVGLEQEMVKASGISRAFALNAAVVKAFNGMLLQAAKG